MRQAAACDRCITNRGVTPLNQYRQRVAANGRPRHPNAGAALGTPPMGAEAENPLHVDFGRAPGGLFADRTRVGPIQTEMRH